MWGCGTSLSTPPHDDGALRLLTSVSCAPNNLAEKLSGTRVKHRKIYTFIDQMPTQLCIKHLPIYLITYKSESVKKLLFL